MQGHGGGYKWYSAVTGVTLAAKMNPAMNPERPKRLADVSGHFEQWSSRVDTLEKFGEDYKLSLQFKITSPMVTMHRAGVGSTDGNRSVSRTTPLTC